MGGGGDEDEDGDEDGEPTPATNLRDSPRSVQAIGLLGRGLGGRALAPVG